MKRISEKKTFRLGRDKILRKEKLITKIHTEGHSIYINCLRCIYLEQQENKYYRPFQIGFNVSKRNIKKAVTRNLLKRRMRESFRLQQYLLHQPTIPDTLYFFIHYQEKKIHTFADIFAAMQRIILALNKRHK